MINVSLVGFGRIGRDLFRQSLDNEEINIVSVSDTADKENLIYLLKYDSIYGQLDHEIKVMDDGILVNDKKTVFNNWKNAEESDWNSLNTDIVILATGKPQNLMESEMHISKGAKKVFIASTPENLEEIPIEYAQNLVDVSLKYPEYDELVNNLVDAIGFNFEYFDDGPLDVKDLPN